MKDDIDDRIAIGQLVELGDVVGSRPFAIASGDLYDAISGEARRVYEEAGRDALVAGKVVLERLRSDNLITARDQQRLGRIYDAAFAVDRKKRKLEDALPEIQGVYRQMLLDPKSTEAALAVGSIAAKGPSPGGHVPDDVGSAPVPTAAPPLAGTGFYAVCVCGGIGAVFGSWVTGGSGWGTVIGAVIGAAVGFVVGFCSGDEE